MKTLNNEQLKTRGLLLEKAIKEFGIETVEKWMQDSVKRRLINVMAVLN